MAVAAAGMLYSCGGSHSQMDMDTAAHEAANITKLTPADLKSATDSLSYYMGFNEGAAVALNTSAIPEAIKDDFRFSDYLAGVTAVLKCDTSKVGYTDGINEGLRLLQVILEFEANGVSVNRQMLLDAMERRLMATDAENEQAEADEAILDSLVTIARNKMVEVKKQSQASKEQE